MRKTCSVSIAALLGSHVEPSEPGPSLNSPEPPPCREPIRPQPFRPKAAPFRRPLRRQNE